MTPRDKENFDLALEDGLLKGSATLSDQPFFREPEALDGELLNMSKRSMEAMMRVIFSVQGT